ncbi:MAG: hypothetical protein ACQEXX_15770 [Bacillota bacterium]
MAQIHPIVKCEIDPTKPVPEVCAVIMAVMPYHPGQEEAILQGVKDAIDQRLEQLKGVDTHAEPIRESGRK